MIHPALKAQDEIQRLSLANAEMACDLARIRSDLDAAHALVSPNAAVEAIRERDEAREAARWILDSLTSVDDETSLDFVADAVNRYPWLEGG